MPDEGTTQLQEVRLGTAPPDSKFSFFVKPGPGFEVSANLMCNMQHVAHWNSAEILTGKPVKETMIPEGIYILHLTIVYRGKTAVDVTAKFSLSNADIPTPEPLDFRGKSPDIGQALAMFRIKA